MDTLHTTGLAGYAYTALPPEHPARAALRPDYLAALARHHEIKREIAPLLAAWREAGIEALRTAGDLGWAESAAAGFSPSRVEAS